MRTMVFNNLTKGYDAIDIPAAGVIDDLTDTEEVKGPKMKKIKKCPHCGKKLVMEGTHNRRDVPAPACCTDPDNLCEQCQSLAGSGSTENVSGGVLDVLNSIDIDYDPDDVMPEQVVNYASPFDSSQETTVVNVATQPEKPTGLVHNVAPPECLPVLECAFPNPLV